MLSKKRGGRFTSSKINALIKKGSFPMNKLELEFFLKENPGSRKKNMDKGFAAPGLTYIEEKQIEKRMGRVLDTDVYSQAIAWGEFMEIRLFRELGLDYTMINKDTLLHPDKDLSLYWCGTPDLKAKDITGEIKCYGPKKFAQFTDVLTLDKPEAEKIEILKVKFASEYWQVISNSIILGTKRAELISYMPFESEMEEIKEEVNMFDGPDLWRYRFIAEKENGDLNVLPNDGHYNNINIFNFEVPKEDVKFLTSRVKEAIILLNKK